MKALKLIVVTFLLVVLAFTSNANAADLSQVELQPTSRLEVVEVNSTDVVENLNSVNPNDGDAYYNSGNFHIQIKDYQGAIADYTKAIEINPKDTQSYHNRSLARALLGDKQGAIADWETVTFVVGKGAKTSSCDPKCCN